MFFFFIFGMIFMIVIGFVLYSEGVGQGSWQDMLFGWVILLFGQSQDVYIWYRLGMWYLIMFIMIYVYVVICEDIMLC